jgi:3-hydroxyisobutyrate dehydrogenase-like beta-hydroxyacid dehydrogenase
MRQSNAGGTELNTSKNNEVTDQRGKNMNIGFIGLGLMGAPMANRLLGGGHSLFIHNRTKNKAATLVAKGAVWCDSPSAVAQKTEIVCSMLTTPQVLEAVALGKNGILQAMKPSGIHVDYSTVSPVLTKRLADEYAQRGCSFIHSPVLGSVPNAADGSLLLFVGGNEEVYRKVEPVLRLFGSKIWRFERAEQATNTKLLCNFFIATMISGLAQGLVFAEKNGINPKIFLEILGNSALNAPTYQTKGALMVDNNFTPRFFVEHMLKDVNLVLESAKRSGVRMPAAEVAQELYSEAVDAGLAKEDYSAVIKVLR